MNKKLQRTATKLRVLVTAACRIPLLRLHPKFRWLNYVCPADRPPDRGLQLAKREAAEQNPAPGGLTESTIVKTLTTLRIRYPEAYAIAAQAEITPPETTTDVAKCT